MIPPPSGFRIAKQQPPANGESLYEIGVVKWESETGELQILMSDDVGEVEIAFSDPASFRSQDEGDMIDYWSARANEGVGIATIYTLENSWYLDRLAETAVSGFSSTLRHWVIIGQNQCVEIVCPDYEEPIITQTKIWQSK